MQLFYAPDIIAQHALPIDEARHCFQVLRRKVGDTIQVTDGKGNWCTCEIVNDHPKKNVLRIVNVERQMSERINRIHMAIAPTKNMDRMEWFVEKAVEIGVGSITFIITQNSERRNIKLERIEKKAISAMKQSLKATLPQLHEQQDFKAFISSEIADKKYIAHLDANATQLMGNVESNEHSYCIAIGPEGGFTEEEVQEASVQNFRSVQLGESRLRTETAGIVALTILNQK